MKRHLLLILLLPFLFTGCRKHNQNADQNSGGGSTDALVFRAPPALDSCTSIPGSNSIDGYNIISGHPYCRMAHFNPNNGNEFVHIRDNQLYIFDTITGVDRVLLSRPGSFVNTTCIEWGSNGWIYFNQYPGGQIWKIKSDGSSLTQVTDGPTEKPVFTLNKDCSRLLCGATGSGLYVLMLNADGQISDTLNFSGGRFSWSPDGSKILFEGSDSTSSDMIGYYDLKSKTSVKIFDLATRGIIGLTGLCWLSDSRNILVCSQKFMLFRVDSKTKVMTPYKNACLAKWYSVLSLSPDGKKIIANRVDFQVTNYNANTAYSESNIWCMDYDGWNEHKIDIR